MYLICSIYSNLGYMSFYMYGEQQCCESGRFILGPNFFHPGSRIASKNFSILTKKRFLSSRNYDPGCSSGILILIFYHPGSQIRIRNTAEQYDKKEGNCHKGSVPYLISAIFTVFMHFSIITLFSNLLPLPQQACAI